MTAQKVQKQYSQQSIHDVMLRQMLDLGQSLILLDQNPSLMSLPALGNTGLTICLNLKHGDDIEAARKALTLEYKQSEHIGRLPVGTGIVKLQDRWVKPFLVRFPEFPVSGQHVLPEAKRNNERIDSLQKTVEELRSALNEAIRALPGTDRREKGKGGIGQKERDFLMDVVRHPLSVTTDRYRRLGLSAHRGNSIKQLLMDEGLIDQEKVSVPKGSVTLLKLTWDGEKLASGKGHEVKHLPKNASLEHEYWKELVAEQYRRKGYAVEKEVHIGNGKAVDLVATKDGKRIAIEIETGKSDVDENLRKCRGAGFDRVFMISTKSSKK